MRRRDTGAETHRDATMEAETEWCPYSQGHRRSLDSRRVKEEFYPVDFRESIFLSTSSLKGQTVHLCCFKPNLLYCVTTTEEWKSTRGVSSTWHVWFSKKTYAVFLFVWKNVPHYKFLIMSTGLRMSKKNEINFSLVLLSVSLTVWLCHCLAIFSCDFFIIQYFVNQRVSTVVK
jgi:hypothetical protein